MKLIFKLYHLKILLKYKYNYQMILISTIYKFFKFLIFMIFLTFIKIIPKMLIHFVMYINNNHQNFWFTLLRDKSEPKTLVHFVT